MTDHYDRATRSLKSGYPATLQELATLALVDVLREIRDRLPEPPEPRPPALMRWLPKPTAPVGDARVMGGIMRPTGDPHEPCGMTLGRDVCTLAAGHSRYHRDERGAGRIFGPWTEPKADQ